MKYKVIINPLLSATLSSAEADRVSMIEFSLAFLVQALKATREIKDVELQPDHSLIIESDVEIEHFLKQLGGSVIVEKIS